MTLTQLKPDSSRFFTNFRLTVKKSRKILVFVSVLQLLGFPLLSTVFVAYFAGAQKENYTSISAFIMIAFFCIAAAVMCGIFIAVTNFSYLHKKSQVDMVCSLPIKKKYKFLSDFLAGLAVYILPYIAACILSCLIFSGGVLCIDSMNLRLYDNSLFIMIIQLETAGLLIMTMLYTLSVFVLCCCGTLFESVMNIFMINGLIPGGIGVVSAMLFAGLYGVPVFETVVPFLGYTSPLGAMIYLLRTMENTQFNSSKQCLDGAVFAKWSLMFLLFTFIYFLLSAFLYKKRKAEDVSKPYVFKLLYYILITTITMAISLFTKFDISTLIPVIIFSIIIYMIFEVITNRGFKKIYKSFIRYGVTMLAILIICVTASATHGFGVEGKTYSPNSIKSVEISYCGIDGIMNYWSENEAYYSSYVSSSLDKMLVYTDKSVIEKINDIQKQTIDTYRSNNYDMSSGVLLTVYEDSDLYETDDMTDTPLYDITFRYNLKSGGSTTRNYTLSFNQLKQLFDLDDTEQVANYRSELLLERISNIEYTSSEKKKITYILDYSRLKVDYDNTISTTLSVSEAHELAECYRQDYLDADQNQLLTSRVTYYISSDIPVRECFTRTLDFIRSHTTQDAEPQATLNGILIPPNDCISMCRNDITATFSNIYITYENSCTLTDAQTRDILEISSANYYSEDNCYVMKLDGVYYAVLPEYQDIADSIYNSQS